MQKNFPSTIEPDPGGVPAISRRLSAATPPERTARREFDPGGVAGLLSAFAHEMLSPLRGEIVICKLPGVSSAPGGLNPRLMSGTPLGWTWRKRQQLCKRNSVNDVPQRHARGKPRG